MKHLIVIGGPTACGKTQVAIALAGLFKCEIISADSRQVYSELNIGVNKPSENQLTAVPHHLIGYVSIHESYNAGVYEQDAIKTLELLFQKNDLVILAGGTGMYIKAVLQGLDQFPEVDPAIVEELKSIHINLGIESLKKELNRTDPEYFVQVDVNNPHRLIRALSVIRSSGIKYSEFLSHPFKSRDFQTIPILLTEDRHLLYNKIDQRVDEMIEQGLEEEAKNLYPFRHLNSLQTVGYTEWFLNFDGTLTKDQTIDKIKQHTRNYAKRQWTWFKPLRWPEFRQSELDRIKNHIENTLQ